MRIMFTFSLFEAADQRTAYPPDFVWGFSYHASSRLTWKYPKELLFTFLRFCNSPYYVLGELYLVKQILVMAEDTFFFFHKWRRQL